MKKILMTLVVAGLMLSGCTKNETDVFDIPNPDVIGFSPSTTRAPINDLSKLIADGGGFIVYGVTADDNTTWYENVEGKNYAYASGTWGWVGDDAVWPTSDGSYPMTFYAIYPAVAPPSPTVSQLSSNVTIAATAATQVDMLSAKNSAASKPASGQISLTFQHILSKVNFGVIAGHEMMPAVRSVAIRNVHSKNTFDYLAQTWGGTTIDAAGYDYYPDAVVVPPFTTTGGTDEDTPVEIYTGTHSNNLMLMPQSTGTGGTGAPAAWDKTAATIGSGSYIEVVYRITDTATDAEKADYVGYAEGAQYLTDYPAFGGTGGGNTGWEDYTGLGTEGGTQYNGALYVKVGFPVTLNWEKGKGYTYNICLGTANSTNGYYLDTVYYDENGDKTNVPIIGPDNEPVEPGDPVTDGIINFLVDVTGWGTDTETPLQ